MKISHFFAIGALALSLFSTASHAQKSETFTPVKAPEAIDKELRANLTKRIAGMPAIDEILTTPIVGMYEVRVGKGIFYTDPKGAYVFKGAIIDTQTQANLTAMRADKLAQIDFSTLSERDAIKIVYGDGSRRIVVFADPNCSFCKKFEKELEGMKNLTVQVHLIPILGESSVRRSQAIWCSANQSKAWSDFMLRDREPPAPGKKCDTQAITRNLAFSQENGINGTPTIFFEDGSRQAGFMSVDALNRRLDETRKAMAARGKN